MLAWGFLWPPHHPVTFVLCLTRSPHNQKPCACALRSRQAKKASSSSAAFKPTHRSFFFSFSFDTDVSFGTGGRASCAGGLVDLIAVTHPLSRIEPRSDAIVENTISPLGCYYESHDGECSMGRALTGPTAMGVRSAPDRD